MDSPATLPNYVNIKGRMERAKKCNVCGRQCPVYHHYNVPSCNGCKHFFRRSITTRRKYHCPRNGHCDLSVSKCRACRLEKCFQAGMDEQLVQIRSTHPQRMPGFPEGLMREEKTEEQQQFPSSSACSGNVDECRCIFGSSLSKQKQTPIKDGAAGECALLHSLLSIEQRKQQIRNSRYGIAVEMLYARTMDDFMQNSTMNLLLNSDKFEKGPPPPVSSLEIEELMWGKNLHKHMPSYFLMDLFLAIELARTLPVYNKLDSGDKAKFLRHLPMMIHSLEQNYYGAECNAETIVLPNQSTPVLMLKSKTDQIQRDKPTLFAETFERLKKKVFCRLLAVIKKANLSREEFVLLRSIFLCNSAVLELSNTGRNLLQAEAEHYTNSLFRHLNLKMGPGRGAQRLAELLLLAGPIAAATQAERQMLPIQELLMFESKNGGGEQVEECQTIRLPEFAESCLLGIQQNADPFKKNTFLK